MTLDDGACLQGVRSGSVLDILIYTPIYTPKIGSPETTTIRHIPQASLQNPLNRMRLKEMGKVVAELWAH